VKNPCLEEYPHKLEMLTDMTQTIPLPDTRRTRQKNSFSNEKLKRQTYRTDADLSYVNSYDPSAIMPDTPADQLFVAPQRRKDHDSYSWESARFRGRSAYACPEGK
jgi:hypothetical protein